VTGEGATTTGRAGARFTSARIPSTPFWIVLALGVVSVVVFALSAGALFIFGVGVVMAFFLVPVLFSLLKDQRRMAASFYGRVPAPWKADVERILTITVGNFAQGPWPA
jgi:predicted PurR-regulated permease PerM